MPKLLQKPPDQRYELISMYMTRKDYETLRDYFKPAAFPFSVRRLFYQFMREHNLPIHDALAPHHLGE